MALGTSHPPDVRKIPELSQQVPRGAQGRLAANEGVHGLTEKRRSGTRGGDMMIGDSLGIYMENMMRTCINNGDDVGIVPLENIQERMEITIKGLGKKYL